jgi:hypothetical protein
MTIKRSTKKTQTHNRGFKGKTTKLSFRKFMGYLLELNENEPPEGQPLTDDDITESCHAEFGTRSISSRRLTDVNSSGSVAVYRARYNKEKPELLSIRYNPNGVPCRTYSSPVGIDDLRIKAFHYKIVDPRLFTPEEIARILIFQEEYPEAYGDFRLPSKETLDNHPFGSLQLDKSVSDFPKMALADLELNNHRM